MDKLTLITGNANPRLAQDIAKYLRVKVADASVTKFSEGETSVKIEENIRGKDVFIVQSTSPPSNDNLMELLIMIDACRRASAGRITAVLPYRSEEHTSELQSHSFISYAVFCLKKKIIITFISLLFTISTSIFC